MRNLDICVHYPQCVSSGLSATWARQLSQSSLQCLQSQAEESPQEDTIWDFCCAGQVHFSLMHFPQQSEDVCVTWRSRLIEALPMGVHLPLEPALAMPSSTTSAVKFIACRHSCTPTTTFTALLHPTCMPLRKD